MQNLAHLTDSELLETRICDLKLEIKNSFVRTCIERVFGDLDRVNLKITPHFWVSDEWFSPDGVPGIAVPFYLLHPRLMKLEKKMMGEVEGGTNTECLKILRHEMGHVLDNAFRLRTLKTRQKIFGPTSTPYPDSYYPVKESKKYVHHLKDWYSQAHPDEDWAETFALWLSNSNWKKNFKDWECISKLEYLNEVMKKIAGKKPKTSNRRTLDPINKNKLTLREYYLKKRKHFRVMPEKINSLPQMYLKKYKWDFYKELAQKTGQNSYNLKQIYRLILDKNEVKFSGNIGKKKAMHILTRQGVKYFRKRRIRIAM